jgi:hypothetical protein
MAKVSTKGYKKNSKDNREPFLRIPSGNITMKEDDGTPLRKGPILGIDNFGNRQFMMPGLDYQFPGNSVYEIPMMSDGGNPTDPPSNSNPEKPYAYFNPQLNKWQDPPKDPNATIDWSQYMPAFSLSEQVVRPKENPLNAGIYDINYILSNQGSNNINDQQLQDYYNYVNNKGSKNYFYDTHEAVKDDQGNYTWKPKAGVDYNKLIQGTPLNQFLYKAGSLSSPIDQFGNPHKSFEGLEMGYSPYNIWSSPTTGIGIYDEFSPNNVLSQINFTEDQGEYPTIYFLNAVNGSNANTEDIFSGLASGDGKLPISLREAIAGKMAMSQGQTYSNLVDSFEKNPEFGKSYKDAFNYNDDLVRLINAPNTTIAGALPLTKEIVAALQEFEKNSKYAYDAYGNNKMSNEDIKAAIEYEKKVKAYLLQQAGLDAEGGMNTLMHYNYTTPAAYSEINRPGVTNVYQNYDKVFQQFPELQTQGLDWLKNADNKQKFDKFLNDNNIKFYKKGGVAGKASGGDISVPDLRRVKISKLPSFKGDTGPSTFEPSYDVSKSVADNIELNRRAKVAGWNSVAEYEASGWKYKNAKEKKKTAPPKPQETKQVNSVADNISKLFTSETSGPPVDVNALMSNPAEYVKSNIIAPSQSYVVPTEYYETLRRQELPTKESYRNNRYYPYPSPEGGNPTIGYGHKLTDKEFNSGKFKSGLTAAGADSLFHVDVDDHLARAKQRYDAAHGAGAFNKLNPELKTLALDFTYNGIDLGDKKVGYPKFWTAANQYSTAADAAIKQQARQVMLNNYVRNMTDPKTKKFVPLGERNKYTLGVLDNLKKTGGELPKAQYGPPDWRNMLDYKNAAPAPKQNLVGDIRKVNQPKTVAESTNANPVLPRHWTDESGKRRTASEIKAIEAEWEKAYQKEVAAEKAKIAERAAADKARLQQVAQEQFGVDISQVDNYNKYDDGTWAPKTEKQKQFEAGLSDLNQTESAEQNIGNRKTTEEELIELAKEAPFALLGTGAYSQAFKALRGAKNVTPAFGAFAPEPGIFDNIIGKSVQEAGPFNVNPTEVFIRNAQRNGIIPANANVKTLLENPNLLNTAITRGIKNNLTVARRVRPSAGAGIAESSRGTITPLATGDATALSRFTGDPIGEAFHMGTHVPRESYGMRSGLQFLPEDVDALYFNAPGKTAKESSRLVPNQYGDYTVTSRIPFEYSTDPQSMYAQYMRMLQKTKGMSGGIGAKPGDIFGRLHGVGAQESAIIGRPGQQVLEPVSVSTIPDYNKPMMDFEELNKLSKENPEKFKELFWEKYNSGQIARTPQELSLPETSPFISPDLALGRENGETLVDLRQAFYTDAANRQRALRELAPVQKTNFSPLTQLNKNNGSSGFLDGISLERGAPKRKSTMYKASENIEDANFDIRRIYRGDKEKAKTIKVIGKSGDWTANRSADGTYYFNAGMSNPFESGKAMLQMDKLLPPKPVILEPNSLSLDSYKNTIKLGQRPHWNMEFENYIPLNHSAIHNTMLSDKFKFKPEATQMAFKSLDEANIALKDINTWLKEQGVTQKADVIGNGNGDFGITIPNFRLSRDYKKGGETKRVKINGLPKNWKTT